MEARTDSDAPAAGSRIPDVPYPGLRPFLDHEEILLFGRERQVREVIERLRQTQFVAVLGGSGSGKSSLILAGVVPELRSFGIPGAGDFWVPLVCTPGTNATLEDQQRNLNTPLTRLARKFGALLKSRGSAAADEERLLEIAACLRKERGLAQLVRQFTPELKAPPGPDPKDARFLFVIDQFEELFHPTTRRAEDARQLIERVIDHFFSPDPRCYLVLTMRSEHLNDCAGYLELPDAINKASFLVPRLGPEDLRAAITGPAQRLLRLRQRADDDDARLPDAVAFEDAVVDRLLADTRALDANPDHLPLLQHVLARLWDAAVMRVADRLDLPDRIVMADLAVATCAHAASAPPEGVNVLTESLESWAKACWKSHDDEGRRRLDLLLHRLGVKDPNTGMYSQERIEVGDAARLLGLPSAAELRTLLERGFLDGVDYLFWDRGDPSRVTLKVSHESFIRGWSQLREAIDEDADRFTVFIDLLRRTGDWKRGGRNDADLLETADLRRAEEAGVATLLADPADRMRSFRRLEATHAYAPLGALGDEVDAFLQASQQRQQARADGEKRRQRHRRWIGVAALLALPPLAYWTLIQGPVIHRTSLMFEALTRANGTPLRNAQSGVGSETRELGELLVAARRLEEGWSGDGMWTRLNRGLVAGLGDVPFVRVQRRFVDQVMGGSEPAVNGSLRDMLQAWLWQGSSTFKLGTVMLATTNRGRICTLRRTVATQGSPVPIVVHEVRRGTLLTAVNPNTVAGAAATRSIFVPEPSEGDAELEVRAASLSRDGECSSRQQVMGIPRALEPVVAFDANLRNLLFFTNEAGTKTVTVTEIDWEQPTTDGSFSVKRLPPTVITGAATADHLLGQIRQASHDPSGPATLVTLRVHGGRVIQVGDHGWRLVDELAQRIPEATHASLRALEPARSAACLAIQRQLEAQEEARGTGFATRALEDPQDERHCFVVQSGVPDAAVLSSGSGDSSGHTVRYRLVAAVYPRPEVTGDEGAVQVPAPIARMPRFGRSINPVDEQQWFVGAGEGLEGWLVSRNEARKGEPRHVGTPWSTCALFRLGRDIYKEQTVPAGGQAAEVLSEDKVCEGR